MVAKITAVQPVQKLNLQNRSSQQSQTGLSKRRPQEKFSKMYAAATYEGTKSGKL